MSAFRQVFEVARRDFLQRARSRAFLILTLVTVAAIFAGVPLLARQVRDAPPSSVGVTGTVPDGFDDRLALTADALGFETEVLAYRSVQEGEDALEAGEIDALVIDGATLEFATEGSDRITAAVNAAVQSEARDSAITELGLTPAQAQSVLDPPGVEQSVLSPPDDEQLPRRIGAYVGSILLYMAILIFGQFIMLGVMQEKQNRVVEVVLSRMRAERLLTGKILGIGSLGLLQLVVIGGALVGAVTLVDMPGVDVSVLGLSILLQTILWFLLGFALYSVLYGALGATVTRQEDAQGAALLPLFLLLPGYIIAMTAIESPQGVASVIGSLVPFTAPLVMPVRASAGVVPVWQMGLSMGLVMATTYVAIKLGARIYRGAVLSIGAKVKVREALRMARRPAD